MSLSESLTEMDNRIRAAQALAHEAHDSIKQVRKYTGEPYWFHTDEVAAIVARVGAGTEAIMAAHLHDVIEDVKPHRPEYNNQLIMAKFGDHVMDRVIDLTDVYTKENYPKWNRAKRKQYERERIAITPPEAKTIKLADLISNTRSIVTHDPDFARVYIREKISLLPFLQEGNQDLYEECFQQVEAARSILNLDIP